MHAPSPVTSRRRFVKSALVTATLAARWSLRGQTPPRLRAGFLGAAYSHFRGKLEVIQASPDFTLAGVCEEDAAVRQQSPAGLRWLPFDELMAAADVVIVESAVKDHARDAKRALLAGKHVHVEKPPAASLPAFAELLRLAEERKRRLQIGYMWRYNPGLVALFEAVQQGWLGEVFLVRATMNTLAGVEARKQWAEFPGGAMFEQGCHLIDAVVRLLGAPRQVTPFLRHHGAAADTLADNTLAVFEYPRALAVISSAPLQPNAGPHRFFEVLGSNGAARVQPLEPPGLEFDLAKPAGPYGAGKTSVKLPAYRRYVDEFAALAAAIREDRPLPVPAATELAIQEALLRACAMR